MLAGNWQTCTAVDFLEKKKKKKKKPNDGIA
jgi:hypothetical protein